MMSTVGLAFTLWYQAGCVGLPSFDATTTSRSASSTSSSGFSPATRPSGGSTVRAPAADPLCRFAYLVIAPAAAALGLTFALGGFDSLQRWAWQITVFTALTAVAEGMSLKSPKQHDDTRISPSN